MIREIYFRDTSDPKYKANKIEVNSELEMVLNQIRMILLTPKGSVLGNYNLGLDLEEHLFKIGFREQTLRNDFLTQISRYIKNKSYRIDLDFNFETDGVRDTIYLYVTLNDIRVMGLAI